MDLTVQVPSLRSWSSHPEIANFTDFTLPAGVTLTSPGTSPLIIRATGTVTISGTLDLRGENGNTAGQGIGGSSGGASGTDGQNGSNSWGGSGSDGQGGSTNVSLASTDVTGISGGTGGQGGRSGSNAYIGSGGGGGGGAVAIVANSIVIDGSILVGGGARGTAYQSSGHGGSGVIWLRGSEVSITGSIDATSYCTQCEGEIQLTRATLTILQQSMQRGHIEIYRVFMPCIKTALVSSPLTTTPPTR